MKVRALDMGSGSELAAKGNEAFLDDGKRLPVHAVTGDEEQITAARNELLMAAKNLAQATFSSVAQDRVSDRGD